MATIGNSFLNLVDLYKRRGSNGQVVPIIEALTELNPLMRDAYTVECNDGTKHLTTTRTGLPEVTWGRLYQGIPQSKSTTQQVTDTTGFVEGRSDVDERLLKRSKQPEELRLQEAQAFLESMAQEVQANFFYADTATTPERFKGLGARYNSLSNSHVISGGGTGSDNTSIWFVTHGALQTRLIYPEGTAAGVQRQDRGSQQVADDQGRYYFAKVEEFRQDIGVSVGDYRYNVRIPNIDVSDMRAGNVDLYDLMRKAYYRLEGRRDAKKAGETRGIVTAGRTVIYANRDVLEALDGLASNAGSSDNFVRLTRKEVEGEEVLAYRGIPIRETDALINAEQPIV